MDFGSLLAHFKEIEQPDNIVPLIDDVALRNGLCAWKSVILTYGGCGECLFETEAEQWDWMWKGVTFDFISFAIVAGCRQQDMNNIFHRLKGLRLIYPDNSMNSYAQKYLQALIMGKLPKPSKKK